MHDNAAAPIPADPARQPKLLERMRIHLRTRHYSIRTEEAYIDWGEYHHGLYACAQQGRARHFEPARCAVKHQRPVTGPLLFAGAAP